MTYDVSKLPAVRAQLECDLAARGQPPAAATPAQARVGYARAPQASGASAGAGRPLAVQETIR